MNSDSFLVFFDIVILFYGAYMVYSGYQMKRTHQPSNLLINQSELIGARDPKGFCEAMFQPLIIFGCLAIVYGIAAFVNDKYLSIPMLNFAAVALFLILCVWFLKITKKNKEIYIK